MSEVYLQLDRSLKVRSVHTVLYNTMGAPQKERDTMDIGDISKEDFQAYKDVRESGVTNMFAANKVSELSGLSREKIITIMKNYSALRKKYPKVRTLEVAEE